MTIATGYTPFFVCATVGTTSSNAIDPVRKIGKICMQHNIWLHVDAAMAGTAALRGIPLDPRRPRTGGQLLLSTRTNGC